MVEENLPVENATRVVVVTGATSGIGLAAAEAFARAGDRVAVVGRDPARLDSALSRVREAAPPGAPEPTGFRADFAVLDEVRQLAAELRDAYPKIDVLANNAGALFPRRVTTVDGFELTMQANHLAPFLLTNLLRDKVTRVITTASRGHQQGRLDPDDLSSAKQTYVPLFVYGSSKQANILFAAESARRWPDVLSTSYHPGVVRTRYGHDTPLIAWYYRVGPFLRTPQKGAETLIWLADEPADRIVNGAYYVDRRVRRPWQRARDPELAARLWEASLVATGLAG